MHGHFQFYDTNAYMIHSRYVAFIPVTKNVKPIAQTTNGSALQCPHGAPILASHQPAKLPANDIHRSNIAAVVNAAALIVNINRNARDSQRRFYGRDVCCVDERIYLMDLPRRLLKLTA